MGDVTIDGWESLIDNYFSNQLQKIKHLPLYQEYLKELSQDFNSKIKLLSIKPNNTGTSAILIFKVRGSRRRVDFWGGSYNSSADSLRESVTSGLFIWHYFSHSNAKFTNLWSDSNRAYPEFYEKIRSTINGFIDQKPDLNFDEIYDKWRLFVNSGALSDKASFHAKSVQSKRILKCFDKSLEVGMGRDRILELLDLAICNHTLKM